MSAPAAGETAAPATPATPAAPADTAAGPVPQPAGPPVVVSRVDRVARITLDRPPLNVLDLATLTALDAALAGLAAHTDLQVVVLAAAGGRAFSAGVAVEDHAPDRLGRMLATFHGAVRRLRALPAISIAAVRGHCLGGGLELAASCDLAVAAESARFGQPEVDLGCFPPLAAALLPSLVGPRAALELIATGRRLSAAEACRLGLVGECVADADLDDRVAELVGTLTSKSAPVLHLIKRAVTAGTEAAFGPALAATERLYAEELPAIEDMAEGLAAFLAKRPPHWKHR